MSVIITSDSSTITFPPMPDIEKALPCRVSAESKPTTSAAITFPLTTWYKRISFNAGMSASNESKVPSGSLPNASSVGANTVNGPSPDSTPSNSAACKAVTNVVKRPSSTAISTIFFDTSSTDSDSSNFGASTTGLEEDIVETASSEVESEHPTKATRSITDTPTPAKNQDLLFIIDISFTPYKNLFVLYTMF